MLKKFQLNKSLSELSTFGIGGNARYFYEVSSIEEMQEVLRFCYSEKLPIHIVGNGSNSLFDDQGFDGVVVHNKIHFCVIEKTTVHVGAGYPFSLLGTQAARKGLSGLEFASGIPASIGGAIFMNAGANGGEVKDTLQEVTFVEETGNIEIYPRNALDFRYRWSPFHEKKGAIVSATFQLVPFEGARKKQLEILENRKKTQPLRDKSCGCIFRNPEKESAGKLIEACGLKGRRVGGAEVSDLHANFIINRHGATARDVVELARQVKERVKEQTGIELNYELNAIKISS